MQHPDPAGFNAFIDEQRACCLWFLRRDYYPQSDAERRRVLDAIERHGDVSAFTRARAFRACLSPTSNATFVG
ncbi:MAG: hypothetical protein ABMA15_11935 [Vicinamibacterales bacterium]